MKNTMKKFHLVSKYANYPTWDEKQNAPSKVLNSKAPCNLFLVSAFLVAHRSQSERTNGTYTKKKKQVAGFNPKEIS